MPQLSIDIQSFSDEFLGLGRGRRTGTYKVVDAEGKERYLLFQEGSIVDIDTREPDSLLTAAILGTGRVGERDLRRARKAQSKRAEPLGAIILEMVEVPEGDLVEAVRAHIADAICSLFTGNVQSAEFIEHAADERLEDFRGELSEVLEIQADPEDLFVEAASRLDRWDLVERCFSLLREVYYATPDAFRYFKDEAQYPHEVAVIGRIDGRSDFAEVIEAAVDQAGGGLDPFRAFGIIRALAARGEVQPLNPVQLFQLGVEYNGQRNHTKALKLFLRASERGLDDFDISFKIAETLEAIGKRPEAAARYQEFGEKCLGQFRPEDAIKSYRKAAELEPQNLAWQRKLLDLFTHENRRDDAVALALEIAARMEASRDVRGALHLLLDLRRRDIKADQLGKRIIELAEKCGDDATIRAERQRLASDYHSQKDVEKALAMYQQMYCDGNGSPEVRLKLIDLHHQKGNHAAVLEHIVAIFCLPENERLKDIAVLKRL
ncbi:MAG: tetratricopeptide repeat protein, partial [Thermoanaerobaculia bacterium]